MGELVSFPKGEPIEQRMPLDRENLKQYIEFLQEEFPYLPHSDIALSTGLPAHKIQSLLRMGKTISIEDVEALFNLYERLDSGELQTERIPIDKENLRQLGAFLKNRFPELTHETMAELTGITRGRLVQLLHAPGVKYIYREEAEKLWALYGKLDAGEKKIPSKRTPKNNPNSMPLDRANLRQLVQFMCDKYGLSLQDINDNAQMPGFRLAGLIGKGRRIKVEEAESLWNLCGALDEFNYSGRRGEDV